MYLNKDLYQDTYVLQRCGLQELQVKQGKCSLLFEFDKNTNFESTRITFLELSINIDDSLPYR